MVETLEFWLKTPKSTKRMLKGHKHMSPRCSGQQPTLPLGFNPGANKDFQKAYKEQVDKERNGIRNSLLSAPLKELEELELIPPGLSEEEAREYMEENMDLYIEAFQAGMMGGRTPSREEVWYLIAKVFLPPPELFKRHPDIDRAWVLLKQGRNDLSEDEKHKVGRITPIESGTLNQPCLQIRAQIEKDCKPNMTLFVGIPPHLF